MKSVRRTNSKDSRKVKSKTKTNPVQSVYMEKIKENDKIFDEKISTLKQKKIKVIKATKPKETRSKSITKSVKRVRPNPRFTISKDTRFYFIKKCRAHRFLIFKIDNNIDINYLPSKTKDDLNEEQDIYFITKIRELQEDIKNKTDLIIDLQNKLKNKEDEYMRITKIEMEEMRNQMKQIVQEKDEKVREIARLETEIYNQKCIIENIENQNKNYRSNNEMKKEEIENLNSIIDKLKIGDDEKNENIKRLEILNKNTLKDYEILKKDFDKINNEKKSLETLLDDQRTKIDNYRKHINTLRKFIVEDIEGNKVNLKIKENNKIISKNNNYLNSRNKKLDFYNSDIFYNTINPESDINDKLGPFNYNDDLLNKTINIDRNPNINNNYINNDNFYQNFNTSSYKSTPNIKNLLNKNIKPENNEIYSNNYKMQNKINNMDNYTNNQNNDYDDNSFKDISTENRKIVKFKEDDKNDNEINEQNNDNVNKNINDNINNQINDNSNYNNIDNNYNNYNNYDTNNRNDNVNANENYNNYYNNNNNAYSNTNYYDNNNYNNNYNNNTNENELNMNKNNENIEEAKKEIVDNNENINNNNNNYITTPNKLTENEYQKTNYDNGNNGTNYNNYENNYNNNVINQNLENTAQNYNANGNNETGEDPYIPLTERKNYNANGNYENEDNNKLNRSYSNLNEVNGMSNQAKAANETNQIPYEQNNEYNEINVLESQLDLLIKEKIYLEEELKKMPEHPKTLKEIKYKIALNDRISLDEKNINELRIKINNLKEV